MYSAPSSSSSSSASTAAAPSSSSSYSSSSSALTAPLYASVPSIGSMTENTPLLKFSEPEDEDHFEDIEIEDQQPTTTFTYRASRFITMSVLVLAVMTCIIGISTISSSKNPLNHLRFVSLQGLNSDPTVNDESSVVSPCDMEDNGVSYCPGKLPGNIENVHLQPGCVMMSVNDLTTLEENPHYDDSKILTICASMASGVVMVDYDKLLKYGMIGEDKSYVSSLLFSDDSQMKLFSGKNFDGAVIGSNGTPYTDPYTKVLGLSKQKYTDSDELVNDNVYSFLFATSAVEGSKCTEAMKFD